MTEEIENEADSARFEALVRENERLKIAGSVRNGETIGSTIVKVVQALAWVGVFWVLSSNLAGKETAVFADIRAEIQACEAPEKIEQAVENALEKQLSPKLLPVGGLATWLGYVWWSNRRFRKLVRDVEEKDSPRIEHDADMKRPSSKSMRKKSSADRR